MKCGSETLCSHPDCLDALFQEPHVAIKVLIQPSNPNHRSFAIQMAVPTHLSMAQFFETLQTILASQGKLHEQHTMWCLYGNGPRRPPLFHDAGNTLLEQANLLHCSNRSWPLPRVNGRVVRAARYLELVLMGLPVDRRFNRYQLDTLLKLYCGTERALECLKFTAAQHQRLYEQMIPTLPTVLQGLCPALTMGIQTLDKDQLGKAMLRGITDRGNQAQAEQLGRWATLYLHQPGSAKSLGLSELGGPKVIVTLEDKDRYQTLLCDAVLGILFALHDRELQRLAQQQQQRQVVHISEPKKKRPPRPRKTKPAVDSEFEAQLDAFKQQLASCPRPKHRLQLSEEQRACLVAMSKV